MRRRRQHKIIARHDVAEKLLEKLAESGNKQTNRHTDSRKEGEANRGAANKKGGRGVVGTGAATGRQLIANMFPSTFGENVFKPATKLLPRLLSEKAGEK